MIWKVDGFRFLEDDGKIIVRCYSGQRMIDAEIDILDLGLIVKDASAILCHALARALSKDAAA